MRFTPNECRCCGVSISWIFLKAKVSAAFILKPVNSETNVVLVIDDNAITARCVGCLVKRLGFDTVLASDGNEAVSHLANQPFAAVISDVDMPGMNGIELLQTIRRRYPPIPVILMSAFWNEERLNLARASAAQAMLEKPVTMGQLTELFTGECEVNKYPVAEIFDCRVGGLISMKSFVVNITERPEFVFVAPIRQAKAGVEPGSVHIDRAKPSTSAATIRNRAHFQSIRQAPHSRSLRVEFANRRTHQVVITGIG